MHKFEVAIVGASLSGAALANKLGEAGIRVALIDKETFPRRKACGEGLSNRGVAAIRELGLETALLNTRHATFQGYAAWIDGKRVNLSAESGVESDNVNNSGKGIGIKRELLDALVLNGARRFPSVQIFLGEQVRSVVREPDGYILKTPEHEIQARYLVLADGVNSFLAPRLEIPFEVSESTRFGLAIPMTGKFIKPFRNVEIFLKDKFEILLTRTGEDELNISVLGDKESIRTLMQGPPLDNLLQSITQQTGFHGQISDEILGFGAVGKMRRPSFNNDTLLVGDCVESLDPIGGMGMTHALHSGIFAAQALISVLREGQDQATAWSTYEKDRERLARTLRGFTRLTYMALKGIQSHTILRGITASGIPKIVSRCVNSSTRIPGASGIFAQLLLTVIGLP